MVTTIPTFSIGMYKMMTIGQLQLMKFIEGCFHEKSDVISLKEIVETAKASNRKGVSISEIVRMVAHNDDFDLISVFDSESGKMTVSLWDLRKMNQLVFKNSKQASGSQQDSNAKLSTNCHLDWPIVQTANSMGE